MKDLDKKVLIKKIKNREDSVIKELYRKYRDPFIRWMIKKHKLDLEDAKELFQISIVTLYDNVINDKMNSEGRLSTYLFSIGKHKMFEWKRKAAKVDYLSDGILLSHLEYEDEIELKTEVEERIKTIELKIRELGDSCQKLLHLFYYYKTSFKEICQQLNYKNEDSVKTAKYKCLQKLKKAINLAAATNNI